MRLAAVAAATAALAGCAAPGLDREAQRELAPYRSSCLAQGLPSRSPLHTDCVVALYQDARRESAVLRHAISPPPSQNITGGQALLTAPESPTDLPRHPAPYFQDAPGD